MAPFRGLRDHQAIQLTDGGGVVVSWNVGVGFMERLCATVSPGLYRMLTQLAGYYGWDDTTDPAYARTLNIWTPDLIVG